MQDTYIWHKHHLYRRQIIIALLLLLPAFGFGQRNAMQNDFKYHTKKYHFGIVLGMGFGDYRIRQNALFAQSDSILSIRSKHGVSFGIGALASYHINRHIEFRTLPGFLFCDKDLTYEFSDGTIVKKTLPQVYFDFPFEMKFKTEPLKDVKLYLIAGVKYGFDLGASFKGRKDRDMPLQLRHDFGINYGVGMEIHLPLFILSPEFKVFNSVLNIHQPNNELIYSKYMKGLYNRNFCFSLIFEG